MSKIYKTTISEWGNSYAIRLPKGFLLESKLSNKDTLCIEIGNDGSIKLNKEEPKFRPDSIQNLFKDYKEEPFQDDLLIPDESVGDEKW